MRRSEISVKLLRNFWPFSVISNFFPSVLVFSNSVSLSHGSRSSRPVCEVFVLYIIFVFVTGLRHISSISAAISNRDLLSLLFVLELVLFDLTLCIVVPDDELIHKSTSDPFQLLSLFRWIVAGIGFKNLS